MNYQKLFDYMSNEHNVILLEQEMQEVINIVNEIQEIPEKIIFTDIAKVVSSVNKMVFLNNNNSFKILLDKKLDRRMSVGIKGTTHRLFIKEVDKKLHKNGYFHTISLLTNRCDLNLSIRFLKKGTILTN